MAFRAITPGDCPPGCRPNGAVLAGGPVLRICKLRRYRLRRMRGGASKTRPEAQVPPRGLKALRVAGVMAIFHQLAARRFVIHQYRSCQSVDGLSHPRCAPDDIGSAAVRGFDRVCSLRQRTSRNAGLSSPAQQCCTECRSSGCECHTPR